MFVVLWEYIVKPEADAEFRRIYGPEGEWVRLFRQSDGFVRTELLADPVQSGRFLTLDSWRSQDDFEQFQFRHREEYAALDKRCDSLTIRELKLGQFETIDP